MKKEFKELFDVGQVTITDEVAEDEEITPYDLWDAFTTPEEALAAIQEEIERIKK